MNLAEKSLIAELSVYNAIQSAQDVKNVVIKGGMMKDLRNAFATRKDTLNNRKKEEEMKKVSLSGQLMQISLAE